MSSRLTKNTSKNSFPSGRTNVCDKHGFTMSRLDILPAEIVDHIFRLVHSLKFEMSLSAIKSPYRRNSDFDNYIWSVFFSSDMTNAETREWYLLDRWRDIDNRCHPRWLTPDLLEEMERSKYVGLYKDFLFRLRNM